MTMPELEEYLKAHLDYELQWLLRAATEWYVQDRIKLEIEGYQLQVYAMDSAFLHGRTLFEFFTQRTTGNYYGCDAFGVPVLVSSRYPGDWKAPLHSHAMHAQDRTSTNQLTSFDGASKKGLNQMPVDFAMEIVILWREFAPALGRSTNQDIQNLEATATNLLTSAIENAKNITTNKMVKPYGVVPIPW